MKALAESGGHPVSVSLPPQPEIAAARSIVISGRVQGVGFRPFVYRLAHELGLHGSVLNGSGRVYLHAEGSPERLDELERRLLEQAPPLAKPVIDSISRAELTGSGEFLIRASLDKGEPEVHVPPDLFTCDECLAELAGPEERRHGYPFINCTQCGPRYTLITAMPYDRPNTSLKDFPLCDDCRREYESPLDRRFHAQPLACPACGPSLSLEGPQISATGDQALAEAVRALAAGAVIAVKGVGGYHLICDAANSGAVDTLRRRKRRPHKPLAVMFPIGGEDGLEPLRRELAPDEAEARALLDPARPIVLIRKGAQHSLSKALAPGLQVLGAFLPYSPLHHLLLRAFGRPVVATSGNISGEPVITDNSEAIERLSGIADVFLNHNRPIVRPADDPVIALNRGRTQPLRLGRGTAPLELELPFTLQRPLLATGGHMKNTVALGWGRRAVISPHVGELDAPRSRDVFEQVAGDLQALYGVEAETLVTDLNPGYAGSRWAGRQALPVLRVQHHAAHASALAGEHPDIRRWLVFAWDGVGLGPDGTLWGGEALTGAPGAWQRSGSFRTFRLTGGDKAGREPWRSATGLAWALGLDWSPPGIDAPVQLARSAWRRQLNTHETSAVGRLFDAAACLVLGRTEGSFEGQGPMELEHLAATKREGLSLPLAKDPEGVWRSDWAPLWALLTDSGQCPEERAGLFHASLARALVDQALAIQSEQSFDMIGLTGGVFQNRLLCGQIEDLLVKKSLPLRVHSQVPANDGGLSFGQLVEAGARPS
jgi:hydrogenase maturation protein HypF